MTGSRLDNGGRINRGKEIEFRFDGKRYRGYEGDTLASALLANDVRVIGRSFKYHRPRGIVSAGADEPNAIFQVGEGASALPNLRATQVELHDGMNVYSTRGWPSTRFDVSAVNNLLGRMFGAGFYYKTFMRPRRLWNFFEHVIRHSAGFGRAPDGPDPDHYDHRNAHCDVLVVGAGPAGLAAAMEAANSGADVIIVDEQNEFGGRLLDSNETVNKLPAADWLASITNLLMAAENVRCLPRSTVFGYYDDNFVTVVERRTDHLAESTGASRQRLWRIRAVEVILAQGAFERPLVFCNNDRPGVMLASAVQIYVNRFAVLPGRRAVVFTNNDSAYEAAMAFYRAGGNVVAIIDSRSAGTSQPAVDAGIPVMHGHVVTEALGSSQIRGGPNRTLGRRQSFVHRKQYPHGL